MCLKNRFLDLCGVVCCCAYVCLAVLSRKVTEIDIRAFLLLMGIAWCGTLAAYFGFKNGTVRRILFWGVLFRLIAFWGEPLLDDDDYRYLWDGRSFALTGNPYQDRPMDHFADEGLSVEFREILDNINHPHIPTIYGPVCQFVFLLSYWIAPGHLFPIKLILLVVDVVTILILFKFSGSPHVLLYTWCPLLIQEMGFSAHPDSLGIFFIVAALYALKKKQDAFSSTLLACAVGTKVFAVLIVPFLLKKSGRRAWVVFVVSVVCLYAPFWFQGSGADWTALTTFLREWEFNSSGYAVLSYLLGSRFAKVVSGILFAVFYLFCFGRHREGIPRGDWVYGVFFLLSPVLNPWYLLWLLPFAVFYPSAWAVTALMAVNLSYIYGMNLPEQAVITGYNHPVWVRPLEFGVIIAALICDAMRQGTIRLRGHKDPTGKSGSKP